MREKCKQDLEFLDFEFEETRERKRKEIENCRVSLDFNKEQSSATYIRKGLKDSFEISVSKTLVSTKYSLLKR